MLRWEGFGEQLCAQCGVKAGDDIAIDIWVPLSKTRAPGNGINCGVVAHLQVVGRSV